MAKQLREPAPSSSVARLFDMQAAARAVAVQSEPSTAATHGCSVRTVASETRPGPSSAEAARPPAQSEVVRSGEHAFLKRELVLTPGTDQVLTRLVDLYRRETGTRLSASHVARAVLKGIAHSMHTLEREARRLGPMKLPGNARGRELDRERFEARIADAFVAGVRAASAFDPGE